MRMRLPYGLTHLLLIQMDRSSDPTSQSRGRLTLDVVGSKSPEEVAFGTSWTQIFNTARP